MRTCEENDSSPETLDTQFVHYIRLSRNVKQDEYFSLNSWLECEDKLWEVAFLEKSKIEDHPDSIQVDFANESIGGFFLLNTYTQEDIIFINSPELQPAVLLCELMKDNEAILLVGAQRYSEYTGYLDTYRFKSDFVDLREMDELNRKKSWIIAIDSIDYGRISKKTENSVSSILRELNKALIGFEIGNLDRHEIGEDKPISTGNWGTGAFWSDFELKFVIQWLACSRANRAMIYSSFSNPKTEGFPNFIKKVKHLTVSKLMKLLIENCESFNLMKSKSEVFGKLIYELEKDEFDIILENLTVSNK